MPASVVPERALMVAVLTDALSCASATDSALAAPAHAWITSDDRAWPYSFRNICEVLDLNPAVLRAALPAAIARVQAARERRARPMPSPTVVTALVRQGLRLREVAQRLGISMTQVSVRSGGLAMRRKRARDAKIIAAARAGQDTRTLTTRFHLSRWRVQRIVARGAR